MSRRGRPPRPTARPAPAPAGPGPSPRGALARFAHPERALPGGRRESKELSIDTARLDLGDHGGYLAEEVVACADSWAGPRERTGLALALLATRLAARQGSTRIPLDPKGPLRDLVAALVADRDTDEAVASLLAVTGSSGLGSRGGGLVGGPDETRPLIVDDGALYQHRLWFLETRLAGHLAARIAAPPSIEHDGAAAAAAVADVAARPATVVMTHQQSAAVRTALGGRIGVVSGGPGTGKTAIIVSIVRALARLGIAGRGAVALAAPTGKAANRIAESVERDLRAIADPDDADRGLAAAPPAAQTLHRLLGWRPDGEFRHSELSPLPHAAVIVDEASMIDLALMERLARSVRPDARLILLGDARQLPSVDAGAVLADLVAFARGAGAAWAIELTESHRMRDDDPAGRAVMETARAVDAGQLQKKAVALRVSVGDSTGAGVELVTVEKLEQLGDALDAWWQAGAGPRFRELADRAYRRDAGAWADGDAEALRGLLALHEERRILTVTRSLPTGAAAVNARLHQRMLEISSAELAPDFLPGEPVLITANDYERGLYNGDQGVVVRVVDADGAQRWRAVFRRGGELIPLPIDAVRASLELAWAMTVHKSQGSELDRIALVLPQEDHPLCTRELIYTALTRARHGALVVGAWSVLEHGASRSAVRHSGLATRLGITRSPDGSRNPR